MPRLFLNRNYRMIEYLKNKKIGLVLSGGGMRGMAHIGVVRALIEYGIDVRVISGTSMGALVGAMHAANIDPKKMLEIFKSISIFSFRNYTYKKPGIINTSKFRKHFEENFKEDNFDHLDRTLYINSTNILSGKHRVFKEGSLFDSLLSSMAYPGMFSPVEINGDLFADGGITNNFPIETLQWECDFIIGSYVNPLKRVSKERIKNSFSMLERVLQVSMYTMEVNSFYLADIFIMPQKLSAYPLFSLKNIDATYHLGYDEAKLKLEEFKKNNTPTTS